MKNAARSPIHTSTHTKGYQTVAFLLCGIWSCREMLLVSRRADERISNGQPPTHLGIRQKHLTIRNSHSQRTTAIIRRR